MLKEYLNALFFIFMAEMGDKTQLLAMAFATKYSLHKVLSGVLLGSLLNHGLAVVLGSYLTHIIPLDTIRLFAALAFIVFGLWSLRIEDEEAEGAGTNKFGPVLTVAAAFFIGELGDKTQLTAITLSSKSSYPAFILMGTVTGMVLTSAVGVFVGGRLGKRVPELALKIVSSIIFVTFGLIGLQGALPGKYLTPVNATAFILILLSIHLFMIIRAYKKSRSIETPYVRRAEELYLNTHRIQQSLEKICTRNNNCSACRNGNCTIQQINRYLKEAQETESFITDKEWKIPLCTGEEVDLKNVKESLKVTIDTCLECSQHKANCVGNQTRRVLETLYFGKPLPYTGDKKEYYRLVERLEPGFFNKDGKNKR